jgi:site-specific recombinase XerD
MNLLESFRNYLFSQEDKPTKVTVKNYLSDINHFVRWYENTFAKNFDPKEISNLTLNDYRANCSAVFSPSSLDRHFSSLRKFFQFLLIDGKISLNPFVVRNLQLEIQRDPWRIKDFKDFLYIYNASRLTIKNYLIDVKQFLAWAQEVTVSTNVLAEIDSKLVEEYKQRLLDRGSFSPATINRKLSSLRKYLAWAQSQGLVGDLELKVQNAESARDEQRLSSEAIQQSIVAQPEARSYSHFPPLRVAQKASNAFILVLDNSLIIHLAKLVDRIEYALWKSKGHPVFAKLKDQKSKIKNLASNFQILSPVSSIQRPASVKNLPKEFYAPLHISTKYFPWYKKAWITARYARPKWYKTYHSYPIVHYLHFAVLIIFLAAISFGFYNTFFQKGNQSPTLAVGLPTAPPRVLSFQGRLTNNLDTPISTPSALRFAIYNSLTATDSGDLSVMLWQEVDSISPDQDGIFNVLLGNNTAIPSTLFTQNAALWLGVTVGTTDELTPRQQLATVAYATNAETLQGLLPITAAGATQSNVVLALDSSGNLTIGGSATPTFQASGGQFTLSGQGLLLTTNAGSNSNITVNPDGLGQIDLQKPLVNTTSNNNLAGAEGAVEVDDMFGILATSSGGQSALTINQDGGGPLINASAGGVAKFMVDSGGSATIAGHLVLSDSAAKTTFGGIAYAWPGSIAANNYVLQTQTNGTLAWVAQTGGGGTSFWQELTGALSPINTGDDLLLGSSATASAAFAFTGLMGNQTQASMSGNLIVMANNGYGGNVGIGTTTPTALLTLAAGTTSIAPLKFSKGTNLTTPQEGAIEYNGNLYFTDANARYNFVLAGRGMSGGQIIIGSNNSGGSGLTLRSTSDVGGIGSDIIFQSGDNGSRETMRILNSGSVGIGTSSPLATLDVRGNSGTLAVASISGQTSFAAMVVDNSGVGDLFTASTSGGTRFIISNTGALTSAAYLNAGGVLYTSTTGLIGETGVGTGTQCLIGGATPTWSSCSAAASNYWQRIDGNLSPLNLNDTIAATSAADTVATFTTDNPTGTLTNNTLIEHSGAGTVTNLLNLTQSAGTATNAIYISGTFTKLINSTNFNVTNAGAVTAVGVDSGSGLLQGTGGLTLTGTTSINDSASTNTTSIGGGTTTGQITIGGTGTQTLAIGNGAGVKTVQLGSSDTTSTTTLLSGSGGLSLNASNNQPINIGTGTSTGLVIIGGGSGTVAISTTNWGVTNLGVASGLTGLSSSGTITFSGFTGANNGGVIYANSSGALSQTAAGSAIQCLVGGTTPTWSSCSAAANNFWQELAGALSPINTGDDLLLGGSSTTSAIFAFTGLKGNQTQASFSGQLILMPDVGYGGNMAIGKTTATLAKLDIKDNNSVATLGTEKIQTSDDQTFHSDTGRWITSGTPPWSINIASSDKAVKDAPGTAYISLDNTALDSAPVAGKTYQITFDFTTTSTSSGSLTMSFGGANGVAIGKTSSLSSTSQVQVVTATNTNALAFTPTMNWYGTIDNISVKQITTSSIVLRLESSDGTLTPIEFRTGGSNKNNIYIGQNSGLANTTGNANTALGTLALASNTTAANNTAVGTNALRYTTTGGSNTAVGWNALQSNTTGIRNSAFGYSALTAETTGWDNVAFGYGALNANTTAGNNTALGSWSLYANTTGSSNVAVGVDALYNNTTASNNTAVGPQALNYNTTGGSNTALGSWSSYYNTTGGGNIAIGYQALQSNVTGTYNTSLGAQADYGYYPGNGTTGTAVSDLGTPYLNVGDYYYRVTYVFSDNRESVMSRPNSVTTTTTGNTQIDLTSIPTYSGPLSVTKRKIYRTKTADSGNQNTKPYYLLTTINNNSTTTYSDQTPDASLGSVNSGPSYSIALGFNALPYGSNQMVIGDNTGYINQIYLGSGIVATTPQNVTINATGGSGTNIAGANLTLAGGMGTGSGNGGQIIFQTATPGSSGTALNSLTTRMLIDTNGNVGIGTTAPAVTLDVRGNSATTPVASISGNTNFAALVVDNQGSGDLITASSSAHGGSNPDRTEFKVTGSGGVYGRTWYDLDNSTYYMDLNAAGTSLITAGNVGIGTISPTAGQLQIYNANDAIQLVIDRPAGHYGQLEFTTAGSARWDLLANNTAESGSNVGSDLQLNAYADNGAFLSTPLFIKRSTGNVGIGTTPNDAKLDIIESASGAYGIKLTNRNSNQTFGLAVDTAAVDDKKFSIFDITNNAARLTIDNAGKVGIGITNPIYPFQVSGTGSVTSQIQTTTTGVYNEASWVVNRGDQAYGYAQLHFQTNLANRWTLGLRAGDNNWHIYDETAGANALVIDTSDQVGIGIAAPGAKLHVSSGDSSYALFGPNSSWGSYLYVGSGTSIHTSGNAAVASSNGNLHLDAGAGQNIYLGYFTATNTFINPSGGYVGINTTALQDQLTVGGAIAVTGASSGVAGGNLNLQYTGDQGYIESINAGVAWKSISIFGANVTLGGNGASGLRVASDQTIMLYSAYVAGGSTLCRNGSAWMGYCSSDNRLKHDITSIPDGALSKIMQLRSVDFVWDADPTGKVNAGFIAQETMGLIPESVGTTEDSIYYTFNSDAVLSYAIKAVQELNVKVDNNYASLSANLAGISLTSTGDLNLVDQNVADTGFTVPHYFTLNDALGNPIDRVGAFAELAVANLRAGFISAKQITTNSLSVATENVTINGQSLKDYITSIVADAISNSQFLISNGQTVISPLASIDNLKTNLISPLADNPSIALKLESDKLSVLSSNSASGSAVATIDNQGNASFSGQLSASSGQFGEATVSGTLRAGKIIADQIEGLNVTASTVSAQYITNVTNVYNSTPSASGSNFGLIANAATPATNSGIFQQLANLSAGQYINLATYSSQLAYVENLGAANAAFSQNLMVFGSTSLSDTSIVGQLSVNGSLILADNSINVLGSDLNLQPLRQGGLSIMGGLFYIDTNGNVKVGGNAEFAKNVTIKGTLAANVISPLPGNDLKLNTGSSNLEVRNASDAAVLSVNPTGDLIASGAGTFAKLNLNLVQPALAVSPDEVIATGSAGVVALKANRASVTVQNSLVTQNSLIYITPVGQTFGQSLFLQQQIPNDPSTDIQGSFTVGVSTALPTDTKFNFLIIN